MKDEQLSTEGHRRRKLSDRPTNYVDVADLRSLLKLALGLHTVGRPRVRMNRAFAGLLKLSDAEAWAAAVMPSVGKRDPSFVTFSGGEDRHAARAMARTIRADYGRADTAIGKLMNARQTAGRVLAVLQDSRSIHSVLLQDASEGGSPGRTWITILRREGAPAFLERERRLVELFHAQSAWLLDLCALPS